MKTFCKYLTACAGIFGLIVSITVVITFEILFPLAAIILCGAMIYGWLR